MVRCGHVTVPLGPTWTHMGPHGRLRGATDANKAYWAHGYSGPRRKDRGVH